MKKMSLVKLKIFVIMLCLVLLGSCVTPTASTQVATSTAQVTSGLTDQPDPTPDARTASPGAITPESPNTTPLPQSTQDNTSGHSSDTEIPARYELDALFDYYLHTLSVTETITYMNYSPDTLDDMTLVVEPDRWPGGFSLVSLTWQDGEILDHYELQDDQLHFSLPQPLAPGDRLGFIVKYNLELPEIPLPSDFSRPQPYGYSSRQTNIVDWYPYIPPYKPGEGWLVHKHWWFGEHQVFDIAEFQVRLTLVESVPDLVIAASAPARQDGNTYTYDIQVARTFALSASTEYLVQSTSVGDVTIYSYSFPFDQYSGAEVLRSTAGALQLYDLLLIPYPHASLSVVEADFLDGMEYDGLYFLSHGFYDLYDGTPKGYLTFIAAHETAHQWWYGLVGNDQALEPWLDEALCTYMEHIFYENIYAEYPPGSGQSLVNWWWYYRVNFYDPSGWLDRSIYDFNAFRPYRDAIYLNGANFLEDLRNRVGDQTFFAILRDYASSYKYKIATTSDFFAIVSKHTSQDLDDLFAEYFQVAH